MRLNEDLDRICEILSNELHKAVEKVEKSGTTDGAIEYIDKITHAIKSVKTTIAMMESESSYSNGNSYGESYYSNRGRGRNARRDSMGRYMDAYSGASDMAQRLRDMADNIPDAHKRNEFIRMIAMAENDQ